MRSKSINFLAILCTYSLLQLNMLGSNQSNEPSMSPNKKFMVDAMKGEFTRLGNLVNGLVDRLERLEMERGQNRDGGSDKTAQRNEEEHRGNNVSG